MRINLTDVFLCMFICACHYILHIHVCTHNYHGISITLTHISPLPTLPTHRQLFDRKISLISQLNQSESPQEILSVGCQLLCLQGEGREGGGGVLFATQTEADEALMSGMFPRGMEILKRSVLGEELGGREGGRGVGWEEVRRLERVLKAYEGEEREEEGGKGGGEEGTGKGAVGGTERRERCVCKEGRAKRRVRNWRRRRRSSRRRRAVRGSKR